jgi:DNA topoisomerase-1
VTKPLLVVESPTKIKTIKKYLGSQYNVVATVGHIKDLPAKEIGINIEKNFEPKYIVIPGKQKVINSLKKAAGDATDIYLAPDPDREGEAIAWHTAEVLKKKGRKFYRVLIHELTKKAINEAIAASEDLHKKKYEAQQARRILDRLVGYQTSPLLWRKVKNGLSAGRVQSVAVRIICERERAIQAFESEEYWSITALLETTLPPQFKAKLVKKNEKKIKIPDEKASLAILNELSENKFIVKKVQKKITKKNPLPPFITSKLQQEAIRKLKFSAKKTMVVAQQLYEGIDIGTGGTEGLITFFKNLKKAQDAHEAIRPTSVFNTPEKLTPYLSKDQMSLYRLIWQRFIASQMQQALINKNTISIKAGLYLFTASGSSVKFTGFMAVYMSVDEEIESEKEKINLPELSEGVELKVNNLDPKQHFTMPPPRFSEASLVKELEENGIGRPSTYASILSTIRGKGYVDFLKGYFKPSELGFIVNDLLVKSFPDIFEVDFTAKMEEDLDRIETSGTDSLDILTRFYGPFKKELDAAAESMLSIRGVGIPTDLSCPVCKKQLNIKVGKNGHYIACSGYPKCKYTRNYTRDEKGKVHPIELPEDEISDIVCEKCKKPMVLKQGKYGKFLACSGYPVCKNTKSINSNQPDKTTGVKCPEKGCTGEIVERRSKRGKIFYGCNRYPDCTFALWDKPVAENCPNCGAEFLVEKSTKKQGTFLMCLNKECGYKN